VYQFPVGTPWHLTVDRARAADQLARVNPRMTRALAPSPLIRATSRVRLVHEGGAFGRKPLSEAASPGARDAKRCGRHRLTGARRCPTRCLRADRAGPVVSNTREDMRDIVWMPIIRFGRGIRRPATDPSGRRCRIAIRDPNLSQASMSRAWGA
jgi:hypothetical protein